MYKLELELSLYFVPPMVEQGQGIRLIREFDIPFPPFEDLCLTGNALNESPTREGFLLKEVTWDVDRGRFLATTCLVSHDYPIAFIPHEIRSWIERGWRHGSLEDAYEPPDEHDDESELASSSDSSAVVDPWDDAETWPTTNPRRRPAHFNKLLRAIVRTMAEIHNNWPMAYAIDRTKMVFSDEEIHTQESPAKVAFRNALYEFNQMPQEDQFRWREQVIRRYPRLDRIVDLAARR